MSVAAFEGPAGCGKTHRLMNELAAALRQSALAPHERVLALTFMHGSRRRLDARLCEVDGLAGRFEATTLDSFAWRLTQRWRRLAMRLGYVLPTEDDYNATCTLAATLMERECVRTWVSLSYPIVIVDEAQDLNRARSLMIKSLVQSSTVLLAFDEFQCLNPGLLPIAIEDWLREHCEPTVLEGCYRTDDAELIDAARAVREGRAVGLNDRRFKVVATPGLPHLAATWVANAITWRDGGNVAVLMPSRKGGFANGVVARVGAGPVGRRRNGPYKIEWESSDDQDRAALWENLALGDRFTVDDALAAIGPVHSNPFMRMLGEWIVRQRCTRGLQELTAAELQRQLDRALSLRRRYGGRVQGEFTAMTIQQAKNREFDHVIVLWPYTVPDDDGQRRRLLYNAITRAKRSCHVLVQAKDMLQLPPFASR
jgi:UvrD-like helicase C-terminal domain/AAA domain